MSKKQYRMDDVERRLRELHDGLNNLLDATENFSKMLAAFSDELANLRVMSKSWKTIARKMNGLTIPEDDDTNNG